jgi:NADH-quinone oxidoreductase subunit J
MNLVELATYIFTALAILGVSLLLTLRNLIRATFAFFLVLFAVAGLFAINDGNMVTVAQIIIYVGGILLLTLFGVMLTHRRGQEIPVVKSHQEFISIGVGMLILGGSIFSFDQASFLHINPDSNATDKVKAIGVYMLTDFIVIFELLSVFLLIALIGAVYIAQQTKK